MHKRTRKNGLKVMKGLGNAIKGEPYIPEAN